MPLQGEVCPPTPLETFPRANGGNGGVTLILVLPIGTNFEAFSKGRSVEIEGS